MRHRQSGFTLLEVAIAMAVIGVMIGMIIKGKELILNSRVKTLADDFQAIQVALYGYQDRFRASPGDDSEASAHLPATDTTVLNGNGNEIIDGSWNSRSGESFNLWQHVRLAGFMHGTADIGLDAYVPLNTSGGSIGLSETGLAPIAGLKGSFIICSDNIAGKLVKQLDLTMDDGNTALGAMMAANATVGGAQITTSDIDENGFYLACMGI